MSHPIQLVGVSKMRDAFSPCRSDVLLKKTHAPQVSAQRVVLEAETHSSDETNPALDNQATGAIRGHFQLPCCQRLLVIELQFSSTGYWRLNYVCNHTCAHSVIVQAV